MELYTNLTISPLKYIDPLVVYLCIYSRAKMTELIDPGKCANKARPAHLL